MQPRLKRAGHAVEHRESPGDKRPTQKGDNRQKSRAPSFVCIDIEPALEIIELRSTEFRDANAKAWFCLSRKRTVLAQFSTRHALAR
jgi:hypothetical protein